MNQHQSRRTFLKSVGIGSAALARAGVLGPGTLSPASAAHDQLQSAARAFGTPRVGCGDFISPKDFGVVGNGIVDDSEAFNRVLAFASENGKTVFIKTGMHIRVRTNLFIYGDASIVGENNHSSVISLWVRDGEPLDPSVSARWVHLGIANGDQTPRTWTGHFDNVQFLLRTPTGEVINFHAAENFAFENCIIDQRTLRHQAGNCLKSGFSNLCSPGGSCVPRHGRIVNNTLLGKANGEPEGGGGAGINLGDADSLLIADNYIEGFGDDAIAVIGCANCVIRDNSAKGIRSRIGSFSGKHNTFINNYLERQPGHDGIWQSTSTFYATFLQSPFSIPPTPEDVKFIGNTAVLPSDAPDAGGNPADFLLVGGVQGCVVSGNIFINDSSQQTLRPRIRLIPLGLDPNLPGDHVSRPRSVEIVNNVMSGQFPGTIEEHLGSGANGPIIYSGNIASSYLITDPNSFRVSALTADGSCVDSNRTV